MRTKIKQTKGFQNLAVPSHRELLKVLEIQKLKISVSSLLEIGGKLRK